MAHLWIQDKTGEWTAKPLDDWIELLDYDPRDLAPGERDDRAQRTVAIERVEEQMGFLRTVGALWVLEAGAKAEVLINGARMLDRFRLLHDRDQIQIRSKQFYFAAHSPPLISKYRPSPWNSLEEQLACPRCECTVEPFTKAVCCPQCHQWHHETNQNPCWSQSESCASCSQATDLSMEFDWRPEDFCARSDERGEDGGDTFEF